MSNRPRIVLPGAIYHVHTRCQPELFALGDDGLREVFLAELATTVRDYGWMCDAYVLMRNHYHLLLRTPEGLLSEGMRRLNSAFARAHNRRTNRRGRVWEARFSAHLLDTDAHLREVARYVVLNPVRAGLHTDPADYPWSSYRATAGLARRPRFLTTDWLLAQLGGPAGYRRFVADGCPAATLQGLLLAA